VRFNIDIPTLFAFFGTFQGLVFAAIFWLKNRNISNKIFSLLLLATSVRIAKNIFVHLRELNPDLFTWYEVWRTSVYIGISHQFAIGPLFFLYFKAKMDPGFRWDRGYLWHFVPYFLLVVISPFVQWSFWQYGGLWFSYFSILLYYVLAFRIYYRKGKDTDQGTSIWLKGLLWVVAVIMVAYSPVLFHYTGYIGGAVLYALALFSTGYIMLMDKGKVSFFRAKYGTSSLSNTKVREIRSRLEQFMQREKPFTDPELTLQVLAHSIDVLPHHLSRVINQEFKVSFTDYINAFRLKEAVLRLKDPKYDHLKLSALAYDCGFNSVPTFNTLFKKVYKTTPSKFRKGTD